MCLRLIGQAVRLKRNSENGNVFMAIFGAIALVGLLGASIMTFMKGPLSTSIKLTKMNTAENQMSLGAQVAVMATVGQANSGDCELIDPDGAGPLPAAGDGFVEPMEWRVATTEPHPVGGGLVPQTLGISKKDPWSTEYGYCVWNHGPSTGGNGCGANMLAGTNSRAYPVVAIISAGPDKAFTTTCRSFAAADVNGNGNLLDPTDLPMVSKAAETDDDIITSFTYEEATGASGGLWSLKAGSPGVAVINKSIESSGVANLKGGVLLPDKALINCSDITNAGVMAKSTGGIEICDGAGVWKTIGGGASGALSTVATCAAPADAGNVRFNSVSGQPEFCNGTTWLPFTINTPGVNLVITPNNSSTLNVDGATNADTVACTNASGFTCGNPVAFTVTNAGTITSATTVVQLIQTVNGTTTTYSAATLASVANTSSFILKSNTCTTTLAVNATCTVTLEPKATGNISYTANLRINTNNIPIATLSGSATNFGCIVGRVAPGGNYVGCGLSNLDGSFDLVMNPSGCNGATTNPTCSGGADTSGVQKSYGANGINLPSVGYYSNFSWGAQQHQNMIYYAASAGILLPASKYCDDLTYQGQSDWFLPSYSEMQYINSAYQAGKITMRGDWYMMSDQSPYTLGHIVMYHPTAGYHYTAWGRTDTSPFVRCVRREGLPMPAVSNDVDPDAVSIIPAITFSPSLSATSNTVTVGGILQTITASITGGTNMSIIKNGVPTGMSSVSGVKAGETLAFTMDGPAAMGTKSTATITMGPDSYPWWVGYADNTRTIKGFVTSTIRQPNLGGLSGADAICSAYAAASTKGLSASWKAMLSDSTTPVAGRIPWNWGTLQTVTGATIVDGGLSDLFDGTFDDFFNVTENGAVTTNSIWTGSDQYGASYSPRGTTSGFFSYDWTSSGCCDNGNSASYGQAGSKSTTAMYYNVANSDQSAAIRCIENIDGAVDTIPANIILSNTIQAPLSARQVTPSVAIGGMSPGATTTLSVTATGGNPKFTINGGAEVNSGTVINGDTIVFLMDAPATVGASNKMTITGTSGVATILGYWRVWPGWDGIGTGIKRVFVTSTDTYGNVGGVSGLDSICQGRASAAALGGSWKAIASGIVEPEYAVNRVGYNWNELRLVDGTTVAYAGGLWTTLLNPIVKTEFGVTRASVPVYSNNADNGNAYSSVSDVNNNYNWSSGLCTNTIESNSSATKVSMVQVVGGCSLAAALFCIEQ